MAVESERNGLQCVAGGNWYENKLAAAIILNIRIWAEDRARYMRRHHFPSFKLTHTHARARAIGDGHDKRKRFLQGSADLDWRWVGWISGHLHWNDGVSILSGCDTQMIG